MWGDAAWGCRLSSEQGICACRAAPGTAVPLLGLFNVEGIKEEPNWGTQRKAEEEEGVWAGIALTGRELCGLLLFQYQVPLLRCHCHSARSSSSLGSLGAVLLRVTLHNVLIEFHYLKEAPEPLEERAGSRGELFPCAQMWRTPKFPNKHWVRNPKSKGKDFLARPWCPAGPEAGRTTNICKHSADNIPYYSAPHQELGMEQHGRFSLI